MKQFWFAALGWAVSSATMAQDRQALVIGNSTTQAIDDAKVVAAAFEQAGFEVRHEENVSDFRRLLESWAETCPTGGVSAVYFAGLGHGYEHKSTVKVQQADGSETEQEVFHAESGPLPAKDRATPYRLSELAKHVRERSGARLQLWFFDCVTPVDGVAGEKQGLLEPPIADFPGGMICYAAPHGKTLPKGEDSHLAEALARQLARKDLAAGDLLEAVAEEARRASGGRQEIWFDFALESSVHQIVAPSDPPQVSTEAMPPANPRPGDQWMNSVGMTFCWIPPGSFTMGVSGERTPQTRDAEPVEVTISQGFWMSKYELTFADYWKCRRRSPSLQETLVPHGNVPRTGEKGPGAMQFGEKTLAAAEKKAGRPLPEGWSYRLPTEAEWEYACRAGSTSRFHFGDTVSDLGSFGNFADAALLRDDESAHYADSKVDDLVGLRPAPAGSYQPNAWGLHDMHGNVSEFVGDYYSEALPGGIDPQVHREQDSKAIVVRGGAWCSEAASCQSGFRHFAPFSNNGGQSTWRGMRLVLARER